ncbi:MAG TPA: hypothetical protein VEY95_16605 [Azospirillaceae bacterium]|nr:hypothetical protein [Azospirillaceae bacterium]
MTLRARLLLRRLSRPHGLFRAVAVLLVLVMVGQVVGASVLAAQCLDGHQAAGGHAMGEHATGGHGTIDDGRHADAADALDRDRDGEQGLSGQAAALCGGGATGCMACPVLAGSAPVARKMACDPVHSKTGVFSPIDPGVESRPPIAAL